MGFIRRLKSLFIIGVGWALTWGFVGGLVSSLVLAFVARGLSMRSLLPLFFSALVRNALLFGFWGFMSGLVFATTLAVAEKGRVVSSLSSKRLALWGGLGAVFLPLLVFLGTSLTRGPVGVPAGPVAATLVIGAALGALSAAGTLAVAKRGREPVTAEGV